MATVFTIIVLLLIWGISLVNLTGVGLFYHIAEISDVVIAAASAFCYFKWRDKHLPISPLLFWSAVVVMILLPWINSGSWDGAMYMVAFLAIYITSQLKITYTRVKWSGIIIALLGLGVMGIFVFGEVLKGWNQNSIAIIGFFSFMYFAVFLVSQRGRWTFWAWNILTVAYIYLLFETACRSGIFFALLAVVIIYFNDISRKVFGWRLLRLIILNLPLLIGLLMVTLSDTQEMYQLEVWSREVMGKPFLNGRDRILRACLEVLPQYAYMGTGKFWINYHNSGIAAISVFGILGYIVWIWLFDSILNKLAAYTKDPIVFASLSGFCLIFLQQSLDLGIIQGIPNLVPYMILGVGLGRIYLIRDDYDADESDEDETCTLPQ